jgi:DNA mismatch repair protein MutS2
VLREEIRQMRRRLSGMAPAARQAVGAEASVELKDMDASTEALEELIATPIATRTGPPPAVKEVEEEPPRRGFRIGDRVFVSSLNAEGEIVGLRAGHDVEVQVGPMRVRVDADNLEWRGKSKSPDEETRYSSVISPSANSPGLELHLRGYLVEDAIPALEEYLDQAYLAGLPWVNIVHGHGTGALKKAIRDYLRSHPLVKDYKKAPENEGGDGVTIVRFVPLS